MSSEFQEATSQNGRRGYVPVFLSALSGIVIAGVVSLLVAADQKAERLDRIALQTTETVDRLKESYAVNEEALQSIGSLFDSAGEVNRRQFSRFVQRCFERQPMLRGLGWAPWVPGEKRNDYVRAAQADGLRNFAFKEWGNNGWEKSRVRDAHVPVYFAEPMRTNYAALGFDLMSSPHRRETLLKARDLAAPVAGYSSNPATGKRSDSLVVYLPIYRDGIIPQTTPDKHTALLGFGSASFSLKQLIGEAAQNLERGITLEVFDRELTNAEPIFRHPQKPAGIPTPGESTRATTSTIQLANRTWEFVFTPTQQFYRAHPDSQTWIALCTCLAFTTLICAWIYSMANRQVRVEGLVNERTSELVISNAALSQENKKRKRAQRALAEKTGELEDVNRELESFSYSVSHDLRAPLRAIVGFTGFVLKNHGAKLPDEAIKQLNHVKAGGDQMNELIEGLLQFFRIQRVELSTHPVDMDDMARKVLSELQSAQPERPVQIEWGPIPKAVADRTLIRQVWQNLLSNALKYSAQNPSPVIDVGSTARPGEVVYYVRDNGAGFSMKQAHRLFCMFQRLHSADEFEGTGIGLAHVKKIVQRHGGRIWAEGKEGEGATFFFTLGRA
ncbi:MAG: signal transduction histidine kinase [Yoonia sp.]|jgi:signal transduction histidine kinase